MLLQNSDAKKIFESMLAKLSEAFQVAVPEELVLVIQFGSTVSPLLKKLTDIDLFLVYRRPPQGKFARHTLFDRFENQVNTEIEALRKGGFDLVFSPLIKSEAVLETFLPIYLDFPERSKILFDPFGYGARLIKRVEQMRFKQNIKLEYVKGMRIWNCRGNLKPGEPFVAEF